VDVRSLMRASMYAFGHGEVAKARDTLRHQRSRGLACTACSRCEVECALGLDVRSRAVEMVRVLDGDCRGLRDERLA